MSLGSRPEADAALPLMLWERVLAFHAVAMLRLAAPEVAEELDEFGLGARATALLRLRCALARQVLDAATPQTREEDCSPSMPWRPVSDNAQRVRIQ